MAISDMDIEELRIAACDSGPLHFSAAMRFARAIEAEVRKDYDALIRKILEALEAGLKEVIATGESEGVLFGPDQHVDAKLQAAIAAARAHLKKAP